MLLEPAPPLSFFFGLLAGFGLAWSPRQLTPLHDGDGARPLATSAEEAATRAVVASLEAALAYCISSIRSMLRMRRKEGRGSVMEMTVAAEANCGPSPRSVLSMRV